MEIVVIILFLSALIYTAIVIAEEKRACQENARLFELRCFHFSTPSWWKNTSKEKGKILFTSSNWQGIFHALPPDRQNLQKSLNQRIERQQIALDPDTTLYHPLAVKESVKISRIEGTATEKEDTRIYLDAFMIECLKTGQRLYGESKSSILGGSMEGPWFEECLNSCYATLPAGKREEKNNEFF